MQREPRPPSVVREEHQEQGGIGKRTTMLPRGILEEKDVEHALGKFQKEFDSSLIRKKIVLDTSDSSPESTMAEFVKHYMPLMSDRDRTRLLAFRSVRAS